MDPRRVYQVVPKIELVQAANTASIERYYTYQKARTT